MGSVFRRKRKDARTQGWYVEYTYGGKRIRRLAKGAETKTEAKAYLREIERQIYRGEYIPRKKKEVLFEIWADRYLEWSKFNKRSWERDEYSITHLKRYFKRMLLQDITSFKVEDYKKKRKSKVSGATVNRELSCLKHMLNMAINEGSLILNPVKKIRYFPERNSFFRILSPDEKTGLITRTNGYMRVAITLGLNTGMRRGEVLNLKWSQVDFDRGFIKLEKTKNGKSRSIPMNSLVSLTLREWKQKEGRSEWIFWNRKTKKPIQDIKNGFKKACEKAGIDALRFHDLRHNFASSLVEKGVDIVTVSELLGHSDINITAKRYSHPSPIHKRQAVESLLVKRNGISTELLPEMLTEGYSHLTN